MGRKFDFNLGLIGLFFFALFIGCTKTEDCVSKYSVTFNGVSRTVSNKLVINGWYRTSILWNELNFLINYHHGVRVIDKSDPYAYCENVSRAHELVRSDVELVCSSDVVIDQDTLIAGDNLFKYFKLSVWFDEDQDEYNLLQYDRQFDFPIFNNAENEFELRVPLSDGTMISDKVILTIY